MNRPNNQRFQPQRLPRDYMAGGYFDMEGYLRQELLTTAASEVAKNFGQNMSSSQLRRFYGHSKTAEKSYLFSHDERKFINDIKQLDSFVAEAKGKEKVPEVFYEFIAANVKNCNSAKDILKGFLPHFQAVVAYFTCHYPRSK